MPLDYIYELSDFLILVLYIISQDLVMLKELFVLFIEVFELSRCLTEAQFLFLFFSFEFLYMLLF